jgi:hypothetical protein
MMGNSKNKAFEETLIDLANSPKSGLANKATLALRFTPGPDADKTLLGIVQNPALSAEQRQRALVALGYKEFTSDVRDILMKCVMDPTYQGLQRTCLEGLLGHKRDPFVSGFLKSVVSQLSDQDLRNRIHSSLNPIQAKGR